MTREVPRPPAMTGDERQLRRMYGLRLAVGRTDIYVRWPWDWGWWTTLSAPPRYGVGLFIERGWDV